MKKFVILMTLFLFSCETSYHPNSLWGGFSETQLSENSYLVSFAGNEFTDKERTIDFALLRSSELTLENGYKYFKVQYAYDDSSSSIYTTPIRVNSYNSGYTNNVTITGGDSYLTTEPKVSQKIVMYKKKPKGEDIYEAEFLKKSIMSKYNIKEPNSEDNIDKNKESK